MPKTQLAAEAHAHSPPFCADISHLAVRVPRSAIALGHRLGPAALAISDLGQLAVEQHLRAIK